MARQTINVGTSPNAKDGDPIRSAFQKVNANFTELYNTAGADVQIPTQTGNNGKYLTTNGTTLSWSSINVSYTASNTAPTISAGALWFNTEEGKLYVNYNNTWVDSNPTEIDPSAIRFNNLNQIELPEGGDIVDVNGNSVLGVTSYNDLTNKPTIPSIGNIEFRNDSMNDINGILITNASQITQPTAGITIPANGSGAVSITNLNNVWTFTDRLTLPTPTSEIFTLTFDASHYTPSIGKPSLTLTSEPWELEGQIQYEQNGTATLQLNNIWPILINPGYSSGDTFTFDTSVHGLPDYTLTIVLNNVVLPGGAGWTANVAASQLPAYPSSISANGAIKLTANTESWVFGGDGNLHFPDGSFQGTAFVGLAATAQDLYKDGEIFIGIGNGLTTTQQWTFGTDGNLTAPGTINAKDQIKIEAADVDTLYETYQELVQQLTDAFTVENYTGQGYPASKDSYAAIVRAKALNPLIPDSWIPLSNSLRNAYFTWAASSITLTVDGSGFVIANGGGTSWRFEEATGLRFPDNTYQTTAFVGSALRLKSTDGSQTVTLGNNGQLTVPGQIRKDGGLYLNSGGDGISSTVFVNGTAGSVILRTDNGTTLKSLTLDVDGVLTLPNNTTIGNDLAGEYSDTFLCVPWGYTGDAGLFSSNSITRPWFNPLIATVTVGWYVSGPLLNGVKEITEIVEQGNGDRAFKVDLTDGSAWADVDITIPYRFYTPDYALVYNGTRLTVDSHEWNFTQAGDLTIPGNINEKAGNGLEISVHNNRNNDGTPGSALLSLTNNDVVNGEKLTQLDVGAYNIELSTDYTGVFTGARRTWEFDRNGVLTFPDSTAYTGKGITIPVNQSLTVNLPFDDGISGTTTFKINAGMIPSIKLPGGNGIIYAGTENNANKWGLDSANKTFYFPDAGDGVSPQIRYSTPGDDGMQLFTAAKPIKITTASNTNWTFGTTGTLTLPASGNVVDSTGVSQLANRVEGSWTVTAGTNNYSFTVPANGAYHMWVRGNIPNGIISYVATVHITNPNVPVIGSQRGYNYTDGGSPILLTSMPTQFVGTEGTIATGSISGTTNNVFVFGISNTSGSNQTVYWGYTKI
jgi:hypothetical protein